MKLAVKGINDSQVSPLYKWQVALETRLVLWIGNIILSLNARDNDLLTSVASSVVLTLCRVVFFGCVQTP